ncbi:MAG: ABC transporter permease [Bacteroidales bacterium]|nr:ABC transporter permease [Bacteroidales bacterium]MBR1783457.1 ABC transporter permease [Bacteroidales bacterium]
MNYVSNWFRDIWNIFVNELRLIGRDNGVMLIFCFAGLVYPVLYNFIYHDGVVDDMPVAVVDNSRGSYSRRYVQKFDATRECAIAYDCVSMAEAEELMKRQKVHGILYIPSDFDTRLVQGEQATLSTYADMSTFLYYKNMTIASNLVMLDEIHRIQAEAQLLEPVGYDDARLYNPNISFTMFFIYMALMMILQQVMFYGSSTLAGTLREEGRSFARLENGNGRGMGRIVLGRGGAYFLIFLFLGVYGAMLVPYLFHMPMHADWWDMVIFLSFFVADIIFFSFTWSSAITKRETVLVLLLFVSPIAVFLTGFTWPTENFPVFWRIISYIFPTTFGCRGYMTLSQTGSLASIAPELRAMTLQTVVYYFLASMAVFVENRIIARREA